MSESVGMDQQGRMDVPKDVANVAWYQLGVKPGEVGNAVFAGHYDKPDGSPAVFYDLNQLQSGDELIVEDEDGKPLIFIVTEKRVVQLSEFPLQEVFGETEKKRVNLITCGGIWDKAKQEYSERTIIFSELKSS
jgi:LPXTG-site transpeptidase (sortase) family protein